MRLTFSRKRIFLFSMLALSFLIIIGVVSGFSATNIITVSGLGATTQAVVANQLKPDICTMNLTNIVLSGSNGTQGNDLILGNAGNNTGGNQLKGLGGDDCIIGGDGDDKMSGGKGDDILIGGAGNDDMDGGQGNDTCYTTQGNDTTNKCENIIN